MLESPQYVTNLDQILSNAKTRRYFLRHLDGNKLSVLASFWVDVHNLRLSSANVTHRNNTSETTNAKETSVLGNADKRNSNCMQFESGDSNGNNSILTNCDTNTYLSVTKVTNQVGNDCDSLVTREQITTDTLNNNETLKLP